MRYWGVLAGKLIAAAALLWSAWIGLHAALPDPDPVFFRGERVVMTPFARDLGYTAAVMVYWLFAVGILYLVILDQRYRCRTCARRLRMPVSIGGWHQIFLGAPHTDYICAYGHGTLRVPEVHLSGPEDSNWEPIDDMWRELEAAHGRARRN